MTSNSASIIRNTITTALAEQGVSADGYGEYIDAATDALVERVYEVADLITEEVTRQFGVSDEQVREHLAHIGIDSRPAPEPVVEEVPAAPATVEEQVADLKEIVSSLAGTVGKLVTLAETKLGATL